MSCAAHGVRRHIIRLSRGSGAHFTSYREADEEMQGFSHRVMHQVALSPIARLASLSPSDDGAFSPRVLMRSRSRLVEVSLAPSLFAEIAFSFHLASSAMRDEASRCFFSVPTKPFRGDISAQAPIKHLLLAVMSV